MVLTWPPNRRPAADLPGCERAVVRPRVFWDGGDGRTLFTTAGFTYERVNYPMVNKKQPAGEVNPATQQIDFYIRSPHQNSRNKPNREEFMHFFGMEVTWK